MKTKTRRKSVLAIIVAIILVLLVISTVVTNVIFSGEKMPKIAGNYLYLHESADMEPDIAQNSLIIAKEDSETSLNKGSKVLCYLADGTLALRCIYDISVDASGNTNYFPGTAVDQGSELVIPRSNIFAICSWQSKELYDYVTFATSVGGLMALLIIPCIILILMFLVKLRMGIREEVDEDDFLFDDLEIMAPPRRTASPLFEPGQNTSPDITASFERKKSSISEHFQKKDVDTSSPYQKAVQERTMKFRIQQQDIEAAAKQQAFSKQGTQVFSTQEVEERARRQQPEFRPAVPDTSPEPEVRQQEVRTAPVPQPTEETPVQRPAYSAPSYTAPAPKSDAPNIDDVVSPSELRAAKTGQRINSNIAATDSIDDLLRVLEAEKKKL